MTVSNDLVARLTGIYESAVHGRSEMRQALREARTEIERLTAELADLRATAPNGLDAELWHQLRMRMDEALGPSEDPYTRADTFKALDRIIEQRDALRKDATRLREALEAMEANIRDPGIGRQYLIRLSTMWRAALSPVAEMRETP